MHHPHAVQVVDQGGGQEAGGNHLEETQRGVGEVGVNLKFVRLLRNGSIISTIMAVTYHVHYQWG